MRGGVGAWLGMRALLYLGLCVTNVARRCLLLELPRQGPRVRTPSLPRVRGLASIWQWGGELPILMDASDGKRTIGGFDTRVSLFKGKRDLTRRTRCHLGAVASPRPCWARVGLGTWGAATRYDLWFWGSVGIWQSLGGGAVCLDFVWPALASWGAVRCVQVGDLLSCLASRAGSVAEQPSGVGLGEGVGEEVLAALVGRVGVLASAPTGSPEPGDVELGSGLQGLAPYVRLHAAHVSPWGLCAPVQGALGLSLEAHVGRLAGVQLVGAALCYTGVRRRWVRGLCLQLLALTFALLWLYLRSVGMRGTLSRHISLELGAGPSPATPSLRSQLQRLQGALPPLQGGQSLTWS